MRKENKNIVIDWADWEEVAATGGLISSVADISKWMVFNMNHGIQGKDTILSPYTRNMMWTPHNNFMVDQTQANPFGRHFSGYGLGWGLSDYHGKMRVGHTGGYDGMITAVTMIPEENLGVVVLTNGTFLNGLIDASAPFNASKSEYSSRVLHIITHQIQQINKVRFNHMIFLRKL